MVTAFLKIKIVTRKVKVVTSFASVKLLVRAVAFARCRYLLCSAIKLVACHTPKIKRIGQLVSATTLTV